MTSKKWFWIGLLVILGITTIVYYPTLSHILKGETYCYFLDTKGDNTAWSLIKNWWNYESVRQIAPGDRLLFRPLLFITLGLEKAYFGGYYLWWRLASLVMHLLAVTCLYRLLWKFKPGILAILMGIFFGTTYLCLNTLLYEQIASYSVFASLLLCGTYYLYQGTETGGKKDLVIASIFMLLACFFHETGIIFTAIFIGYVWWEQKRLGSIWKYWAYSLAGILVIWSAVYFPSKFIHPVRFLDTELQTIMSWQTITTGIKGSFVLLSQWGQQAFFPALSVVNPMLTWWAYPVDIQNLLSYSDASVNGTIVSTNILPSIIKVIMLCVINIIALSTAGAIYFYTKTKEIGQRVRNSFILMIIISLIAFILANALFRTNSHGGNYLVNHNFNLYIWAAILFVGIYILISLQHLDRKFTMLVAVALLIFIGLNAPLAYKANKDIANMQIETREYFSTIDKFIIEHQDEEDLSFDIINTIQLQEDLELDYWRVPDDIGTNFPTFETLPNYDHIYTSIPAIIYERYWNEDNPKYSLVYYPNNSSLEIIK